jgi:hypothetical protein
MLTPVPQEPLNQDGAIKSRSKWACTIDTICMKLWAELGSILKKPQELCEDWHSNGDFGGEGGELDLGLMKEIGC